MAARGEHGGYETSWQHQNSMETTCTLITINAGGSAACKGSVRTRALKPWAHITFARNFRKAGVTMFGIRTNHINRASDCAGERRIHALGLERMDRYRGLTVGPLNARFLTVAAPASPVGTALSSSGELLAVVNDSHWGPVHLLHEVRP
jgi:hypothetical protein